MYLIHLDHYVLEDLLFLQSLARALQGRPDGSGMILVHGSGERAERMLEAEGRFLTRSDGVFATQDPAELLLIERALQEYGQQIHNTLNDEGVACVRVQGSSRGLIKMESDGSLSVGRVKWLAELVSQRVYPLLAASTTDPETGQLREVDLTRATISIARKLASKADDETLPTVVFFGKQQRPGLFADGERLESVAIHDVSGALVHDKNAMERVLEAGFPVVLTSAQGLSSENSIVGTRITP